MDWKSRLTLWAGIVLLPLLSGALMWGVTELLVAGK